MLEDSCILPHHLFIDIGEPGRGHSPGSHDGRGVVNQGLQGGATAFVALEGCNWSVGRVFFTSKNGGAAHAGAIFSLDTDRSSLQLVYESPGFNGFSGPDNINISPRGSLIICEDRVGGNLLGQQLAGLNAAGELFAFSRINPAISGRLYGHDLAATVAISEWAGVCFSPDGQWLFVNVYLPGFSCAITGPWVEGLI